MAKILNSEDYAQELIAACPALDSKIEHWMQDGASYSEACDVLLDYFFALNYEDLSKKVSGNNDKN